MSRHGEITMGWGDGEYTFRLAYGQLCQLQELCDAGAPYIAERLRDRNYRVQYIRETIRMGLIGAGMNSDEARRKVELHCEPRLEDHRLVAWAIIQAGLIGAVDESLGKALEAAMEMKATGFQDQRSPSPESTASALQ